MSTIKSDGYNVITQAGGKLRGKLIIEKAIPELWFKTTDDSRCDIYYQKSDGTVASCLRNNLHNGTMQFAVKANGGANWWEGSSLILASDGSSQLTTTDNNGANGKGFKLTPTSVTFGDYTVPVYPSCLFGSNNANSGEFFKICDFFIGQGYISETFEFEAMDSPSCNVYKFGITVVTGGAPYSDLRAEIFNISTGRSSASFTWFITYAPSTNKIALWAKSRTSWSNGTIKLVRAFGRNEQDLVLLKSRLQLWNNTSTTATAFESYGTDVGLTIEDKYLSLTGGIMSGRIQFSTSTAISRNVNDNALSISGGTSWSNGASLDLCGKYHSSSSGSFALTAKNDSGEVILTGKPDGTLKWDDRAVLTANGGVAGQFLVMNSSGLPSWGNTTESVTSQTITLSNCTNVVAYCVGATCIVSFNDSSLANSGDGGINRVTITLPSGLKSVSGQIRTNLCNGGSGTCKVWVSNPGETPIKLNAWHDGGGTFAGACGSITIPLVSE